MILQYMRYLALNSAMRPNKSKAQVLGVLALVSGVLLVACGDNANSPTSIPIPVTQAPVNTVGQTANSSRSEIKVFAAASLTEAFTEIKTEFEKDNSDSLVNYTFGGSSDLRTQLEQGAKGDIFASADQAQMSKAQGSGLVEGNGLVFVRNRLVVIMPKTNPGHIEHLQDLAKPGVKLVMAQKDVPVGAYTLNILDKMSQDSAFSPDFSTKVQANAISQESSVKQVVSKVQSGVADAGIVYLSDVTLKVKSDLATLDIPDQFNLIASYPISVLKGASTTANAKKFVDYLFGVKAQSILKKYNFVPVINTTL